MIFIKCLFCKNAIDTSFESMCFCKKTTVYKENKTIFNLHMQVTNTNGIIFFIKESKFRLTNKKEDPFMSGWKAFGPTYDGTLVGKNKEKIEKLLQNCLKLQILE